MEGFAYIKKGQPTAYDTHINRPLTNISVAYVQDQSMYKAAQIFPIVPVDKKTDSYFVYTKNDWFRDEAEKRTSNQESAGSGYNVTSTSYSCDVWGFHKDTSDYDRDNEDEPLNADTDATEFVTQRLLLSRERQFVTHYFSSGVWGTDYTGGTDFTAWSDFASSDPIGDITTGKRTVQTNTGIMPNTLVIGGQVWDKLKDHPDIIERVKYTGEKAILNENTVAQVLNVPKLIVCEAVYATNREGGTAAHSLIFGKNALLCYVAPRPSLRMPSAGYIFGWKGRGRLNPYAPTISTLRIDTKKVDRIEGELAFDMKVVASDLGYYFSGAVA